MMEDYFKIVAVIKKKRIDYSYVPHKWEAGNILKWPQSNLRNLRTDPSSTPEDDWKPYPCKVKKTLIMGLEEAELWEQEFVDDGTDAEISRPKQVPKNKDKQFVDRTELFQAVMEDNNQDENMKKKQEDENNGNRTDYASTSDSSGRLEPIIMVSSLENSLKKLDEKVDILNENLGQIKDWMIKINICVNKLLENTKKECQQKQNSNELMTQPEPLLKKFDFPLCKTDDLISFDRELENKEFYREMINFMTSFCGKSGQEDGTKVGYRIIDKVISPTVLVEYSWTGISKSKLNEKKKKCFQSHENIIMVFQEVIAAADTRWTRQKTIMFFKDSILKHSKKRCERKGVKKVQGDIDPIALNLEEQTHIDEELNRDIEENFDFVNLINVNADVEVLEDGVTMADILDVKQ